MGYYTSQLLITLSQFNVFFIIIIGALLGSCDYDWDTFSIRLINTNRVQLCISRIISLLSVVIAMIFINVIMGLFFDNLSNTIEIFSVRLLLKYLGVLLIVFFWGIFSLTLSFVTKSFTISSTFVIGYIFMESFMARFLPESILKVLPVWNQKSFLKHFFDKNEGAVTIIQQQFGNYTTSLLLIMCYLLLLIFVYVIGCKRMEY
jgi:hypothetical protein